MSKFVNWLLAFAIFVGASALLWVIYGLRLDLVALEHRFHDCEYIHNVSCFSCPFFFLLLLNYHNIYHVFQAQQSINRFTNTWFVFIMLPGVSSIFKISYSTVQSIDYRCDNRHFRLSAHNCQVPTPTSQNLEREQQIRIFGAY
jgi:hypothetical protein